VQGTEATSCNRRRGCRQHAAWCVENSEQLVVGHSDAIGSMTLRTAPCVMHNSDRTDPVRFSREREIRRFSWARRSLQGSERPLLRPCRARRAPNTMLGSSARQPLLLRCQAEEQAVSSPTVSGSSFIFQRPTCRSSLAAKDSIPPLDPAPQQPLLSRGMWHFLEVRQSAMPIPTAHIDHRLRPCATTGTGGSKDKPYEDNRPWYPITSRLQSIRERGSQHRFSKG